MDDKPHWVQVLIMTVSELAFLVLGIPLYIFLVLPNHPEGSLPGLVPAIAEGADPVLSVLATIGTILAGLGTVLLLVWLFGRERLLVDDLRMLVQDFTVVDFIPIYIAAGIGEEFLFRVALVEPLGLVLSSLLFTAIHIAYWRKPLILLYVFVFGMICGALYLYTGSFLLCATAHAVYNFTLSCLMKFGIIKLED